MIIFCASSENAKLGVYEIIAGYTSSIDRFEKKTDIFYHRHRHHHHYHNHHRRHHYKSGGAITLD